MRKLLLLAVLALLAAICRASPMPPHVEAPAPNHPAVEVEGPEYRLSGVVRPVAYNLLLSPHFAGGTSLFGAKGFDGVVAIDMEVAQQTNRLELHRGATITHVHVRCAVVLHDPATPEPIPHPDTDPDTNPDTDRAPDPTPVPITGAKRDLRPNPTSDTNHDTASAGAPHGRLYSERVEEMCAGGRPLAAELAGWDRVTEKLTVQLASALPAAARLRLVLSYEAAFPSGALTGFYVSNFTSAAGYASVLATNFKPTHARKAFPCFDEPALKATFALALQLTQRFDAVANTPQVSRLANNLVIFATTPPMSTYLLAFLVFEQATFPSEGAAGALVRTWARREAVQRGAAALSRNAGQSMLRLMEEYTQLPFGDSSIAHAKQVALPDCRARAVESWGLAMAREDALLTKEDGSLITLMHVTFTVAREMVQQWFGNLVTTHWWNTTWLNEGFANYLQYEIIETEHPGWWISEQMVVEEQMSVLEADSAADVAALSDPGVHSPQDIDNQFGAIASSKGAAILRQINNVLGKQNFQLALQDYLNDRKFLDATPEHLFDALLKYNNENRTGLNNEELLAALRSWTETPGYPVLFVNRTGPDTFRLTQRRFLQNGADAAEKYHVYVTWMTSREDAHWVPSDPPPAPMAWLGPEDTERVVTIPGLMANEWAIFNVDQGGYYRVHYDEATWAALEKGYWREDMVTWSMSRVDRAALHHNAMALARAGLLPWRRALCVVAMVRRDNQPVPWAAARQALAPLARLLHHRTHYKAFVNFLMKEAFDRWNYNFPTSEYDVRNAKHKVMILDWACGVGYEPCLEETKEQLQKHFNGYSVHPDALVAARCHGLKGDDGSLWERLWAQYQAGDGALRSALTAALGCTDHAPSLRRYLEQSLDPGAVRGQDAPAVFLAVVANPEEVALQVALQFFEKTGYDALEHAYRQVENSMNTIVDALASRMTETSQLEAALGKRAQQHGAALRAVQANAEWLRVHEEDALEAMAHCDAPAAAVPAAATALLLLLLLSRLLALH